jgi:hypothetical protein
MPLTLICLTILFGWWRDRFSNASNTKLFLLGLSTNLILISHAHSYMALILFCFVLFVTSLSYVKKWLPFIIAAVVPGIIIFYFIYFSQGDSFFSWHVGGLGSPQADTKVSFPFYLWLNWGFFLPLALAGALIGGNYRNPIIIGGFTLLILTHLIKFQPWIWDNTKLITYAYIALVISVVSLLSYLWHLFRFRLKPIVIVLLVTLTFSGTLDVWRLTRTSHMKIRMWSADVVDLANQFKTFSNVTDIVLTPYDDHLMWVSPLSGRQSFMGYTGWLWSYGVNPSEREKTVWRIYGGGKMADRLLKENNIKFVVYSNGMKNRKRVNEHYFNQNHQLILDQSGYKVFKVN